MTVIADRVREVSNSSSTGPMTLEGTVVGFRRFRDAIADGATVPYVIENGAEWEVGYGSFTAPATLNRVTVLSSSNSNAKVDFSAGQKSIWVDAVADYLSNSVVTGVSSVNGRSGAVTLTKSDVGLANVDNTSDANKPVSTATQTALNLKVNSSLLGAASGVATLDSGGKLTSSQIPDISIVTYLGTVASQAAMLALTGQQGDWCIRSDLGTTWVITGANPAVIGGWTQLSYPTAPVTSVNGYTGAVTLSKSDVGLGSVDNTSDATKNAATAILTNKTLTNPVINGFTGDSSVINIGSGQIYKDASGNVGIGTTSPSGILNAYISSNAQLLFQNSSQNNLYVSGTNATLVLDATGSSYPGVFFKTSGSYVNGVGNNAGNLNFDSQGGTAQTWTFGGGEKMRLTSAGYLGIGTSSPGAFLDVYGGASSIRTNGASASQITYSVAGTETAIAYVDSTQHILGSSTAIPVLFRTGGSEKMRLDSSGNLGLGVTPVAGFGTSFQLSGGGAGWIYQSVDTNDKRVYITNNALPPAGGYTGGFNYSLTGVSATAYEQVAGKHVWFTAPSGTAGTAISFTQAMTLDASGNLGIGTSSPSSKLTVSGSSADGITSQVRNESQFNQYISIYMNGTNGFGVSGWDNSGVIESVASSVGSGTRALYLSSYSGPLIMATNGRVERARIDSSGNFLVGTTSQLTGNPILNIKQAASAYLATLQHTVNADYVGLRIQHAYAQSTQNATMIQFVDSSGTERGTIKTNGSATAYNTSSDQRLKTNVTPAGSAIQSILDFPVDQFDWISSGEHQDFGGVAQKVLPVIPEMVSVPANEDDMMGIDWSKAVPRLIRAYQELHAELQELKSTLH